MKIQKVNEVASIHGLKCLLFGMPGSGKTVMSTTTPEPDKTLIVSAESGLLSIKDSSLDVVVVNDLNTMKEVFEYLIAHPGKYTWLIIDSLSEIAELIMGEEKASNRDGRQAYGALADRMIAMCKAYRNLSGLNVVFISKEQQIPDDFLPTVNQPLFPGARIGKELPYMMDEVLCLRTRTNEETGEVERMVQCRQDENYPAIKDRSGKLDTMEPANWAHIYNKINQEVTK